jgi:hypothetical protein
MRNIGNHKWGERTVENHRETEAPKKSSKIFQACPYLVRRERGSRTCNHKVKQCLFQCWRIVSAKKHILSLFSILKAVVIYHTKSLPIFLRKDCSEDLNTRNNREAANSKKTCPSVWVSNSHPEVVLERRMVWHEPSEKFKHLEELEAKAAVDGGPTLPGEDWDPSPGITLKNE